MYTNETSDQLALPRSLFRVLVIRMKNAQYDLNLRWADMSEGAFPEFPDNLVDIV